MKFKVTSKQIQHYNDKDWYKMTLQDLNGKEFNNVSYWYDEDFDDSLEGVIEQKANGYLNFVMWSRNHGTKYMKLTDGDETISCL